MRTRWVVGRLRHDDDHCGRERDRGQIAVEFIGMLPIILLTCVLLWQAVLFGYAYTLAGNGADRAAHEAAVNYLEADQDAQCQEGARLGVADPDYSFTAICGEDLGHASMRASVGVKVPVLIPGLIDYSFGTVTGKASSPLEGLSP
ncbi:pilus assembly protein [Streptomyces lunaelactis]|uniref:TadE/TadG family type IV pilus assembly protein n=1 Tax=Streptomyces lunaelactis TaxID=1535768 RepID=UPI0015850589|nr:TadE family protein [Streptomyces lunaelactis]NUK26350.1 pilus assembly protein [Streptomyces lunaelactis]NUK37774.1 pilus assembly protein [Streptomyces lunaelactis]NUK44580.1 pilus assembly protein [Streptomyces lunaelactis]NUK95252.1 pilus assembly protein [Streptomyces lunaelactis]NUL33053.1 pilus assembly protein [Streptomyces lunaelactis]